MTQDKDISIGSRYIAGGKILDWKLNRKVLSYVANLFTHFWLGLGIKDCTSGFRCFRRETLSKIGLEKIKSNGYLFQIEMLTRCLHLGYSYTVIFPRKSGHNEELVVA